VHRPARAILAMAAAESEGDGCVRRRDAPAGLRRSFDESWRRSATAVLACRRRSVDSLEVGGESAGCRDGELREIAAAASRGSRLRGTPRSSGTPCLEARIADPRETHLRLLISWSLSLSS
jgi:hypothetical protein